MAGWGCSTHAKVTVLSAPVLLWFALMCPRSLHAQGRGGADGPGDAATAKPRAGAPIDLTGHWVSVITQDWRWRMVTPAKGDYGSVPITLEAKKIGDAWDPAKDEAAGELCKAYGAPAIMAAPTRLHITWQDDNTLKVETDTGTQTRLLHFGEWKPATKTPSWQGDSVAAWQTGRGGRGAGSTGGSLRVVTTNVRPGYLRKNGVPYSENAVLTEYWDLASERNGDRWITITSTVDDPKYLRVPYVTALQFKKERDGAKWEPTPCSVR
jgi:hypothetical protein